MSQPTPTDLSNLSVPLTQISVAYIQDQNQFVAPKVFPVIPSTAQAGQFPKYDKGDWLRVVAKKRAPATESVGGGFNISLGGKFFCDKFSVHKDVPDEASSGAFDVLDVDRSAAQWASQQVMMCRELEWIDTYFKPGVWATDFTPGTLWGVGGSTPINDVLNQIIVGQEATGQKYNTLVMGPRVWLRLQGNADFISRINGASTVANPALMTLETLKGILGLDNIYILNAVHVTTAEGQAATSAFMASNSALLTYVNPNPGLLQASAGYTIAWTFPGAGAGGNIVKRYRIEEIDAVRVECTMYADHVVLAPDLGVFINGAVSG